MASDHPRADAPPKVSADVNHSSQRQPVGLRLRFQTDPEMMTHNVHAVAKVESVCLETLHSGVQLQSIASRTFCLSEQPLQQCLTQALRAHVGVRDEIVNVEYAPARQIFQQAESCKRPHNPCFS